MNNFTPDQNPHILSNPETGGVSGGFGSGNKNEGGEGNKKGRGRNKRKKATWKASNTATSIPVAEDLGELENALVALTDSIAGETENPKNLNVEGEIDPLESALEDVVQSSKSKFEVGEDGLSLQGLEIQNIKSQIKQLESRQGDLVDSIRAEITESRQAEIENLEAEKFKLEGEKIKITNLILQAYNNLRTQNPKTTITLEDFTKSAMQKEAFIQAVEANNIAIKDKEEEIKAFNLETQNLIETAIQDKKTELQQQLTEAQVGYIETGAEANDKLILLERAKEALERRLSETKFTQEVGEKTEFYISDQDLEEIFKLYGYVDGMDRIKKLKKDIQQYSGSEQTEKNIQYFARIAKERELNLLRDSKYTLEQEVGGIEGDPSYQEASHLERNNSSDKINLNLLSEELKKVTCEVKLTGKGFELTEDYKTSLDKLLSESESSIISLNTELDRLRSAIKNIRALRNFQIPEGKNLKLNQLKEIEDYLEANKSKSRWNPSRDQDAISRLSPILASIHLRIAERDECNKKYNSEYDNYSNNIGALINLNGISLSQYIRDKLGQSELTDKNSITQAISKLREYIEQYQKPDDFDTKQEKVRELRQTIDTISKQKNDLKLYDPSVIYH